MKKIPLIGALIAAIFVALKVVPSTLARMRRKKEEPDTSPGGGMT